MPTRQKALEAKFWMLTDNISHLSHAILRQAATSLVGEGFRPKTELINNLVGMRLKSV